MGNGSKDKDPLRKNQIEMLEIKKTTTTTKKTPTKKQLVDKVSNGFINRFNIDDKI